MKVVLVSPYELGRQPFGLAEPTAWLRAQGFEVVCVDLSQASLEPELLLGARLVAIHLAMHTATRIAIEALPRIRELAPDAYLCVYGLYAPVNATYFETLGVQGVLGGEFEADLLELATRVRDEDAPGMFHRTDVAKLAFQLPDRQSLPPLEQYAQLLGAGPHPLTVGFAEGSRGCKHLCRHCPVVPVYGGRFRIVPVEIVMADIDQQVAAGAQHISFGDPDFFNGPTHALRLIRALHDRHPSLTYDATVKVEHILKHRDALPELARTGCLFLTSAVESVDDVVLAKLEKNHTCADFEEAVRVMREAGIALAPTFVAFHPWSSLEGYLALLTKLVELELVESVPAIQLGIRLLIPQGSRLLELPGFERLIGAFDPELLGYPWAHSDPRVDALALEVQTLAEAGERESWSRGATFERIWTAAHSALGRNAPPLPPLVGDSPPHHSEPWYCCAEPTQQQLQTI